MPCRALCHHCLLLTYLHKCLSLFLASLFSLQNNSGGGQGEASPCYSLWGGQRPTNSSFWVCGPISLQLQQLCNLLFESLTAMEKCIPDLSTLHETSKMEIDIFPQFHFKPISVLQWKKKSFTEEFWMSISQFSIWKSTSFNTIIGSQRADVPEKRQAKFTQAWLKHSPLCFLETWDKVFSLQVEEKKWGESSLKWIAQQ